MCVVRGELVAEDFAASEDWEPESIEAASLPPDFVGRDEVVHDTCARTTRLSGLALATVRNPLDPVWAVVCADCGAPVTLGGLRWADTGELVADRRRRERSEASAVAKAWVFGGAPLLGAGVGWAAGGPVGAGIGVLVFGVLGPKLLSVHRTVNSDS